MVGHWTSTLKNGIKLELTATAHIGFTRYTYPKASGGRHVLVDLAHVLPTGDGDSLSQQFVSGSISINNDPLAAPSPTKPSYTGYAEYNGGFNRGPTWRIYFCGTFSQAFDQTSSGVFKYPYDPYQQTPVPPTIILPPSKTNYATAPPLSNTAVGALFTWTNADVVESRIGISFISAKKACGFIAEESPADQTFDQTVEKAKTLWNGEFHYSRNVEYVGNWLGRGCAWFRYCTGRWLQKQDNVTNALHRFVGNSLLHAPLLTCNDRNPGLYYTGLMPSNRTGENPGWKTIEPSYDDFYTLWDIFRCLTPWFHLVQSSTYVEMIRSMIDILYEHRVWLRFRFRSCHGD